MDGVLRPDESPLPVKKGLLGLFRTDFCCFCRKILIPVPLEYPVPVHGCTAIRLCFSGAARSLPLPPVPAEHDRFCLAIRLFYFDEGLCSRLQSPLPRTLGTDAFALTYCI